MILSVLLMWFAGELYNGLVIHITDAGLIIDIGCHFSRKINNVISYGTYLSPYHFFESIFHRGCFKKLLRHINFLTFIQQAMKMNLIPDHSRIHREIF